MAPQGRFGAAAAAGLAPGCAPGAAWFCAPPGEAGVGLAASRWVTLPDCLPTEPPPPRRRAASDSKLANARIATNAKDQSFILSPFACALQHLIPTCNAA